MFSFAAFAPGISETSDAASLPAIALLRLFTYAWWWKSWWNFMVAASMCGSSASYAYGSGGTENMPSCACAGETAEKAAAPAIKPSAVRRSVEISSNLGRPNLARSSCSPDVGAAMRGDIGTRRPSESDAVRQSIDFK